MAPSRVGGRGLGQSSSTSGTVFQGESQVRAGTHFSSSFGNTSHSLPETAGYSSIGLVSGDISNNVFLNVANSGPSVGANSILTDANSGMSGGHHLPRSGSFNPESYMHVPTSPMSFSSNNISFSSSSIRDGSSVVQQQFQPDHNSLGIQSQQQNQQHATCAAPDTVIQDPESYLSQAQKKPRLGVKHEDVLQQQGMQQQFQRQDSMQIQGHNPQLQALLTQQRIRSQQQLLQSMPNLQRARLQQQQQQQHLHQQMMLRNHMQPQSIQPGIAVKRSYDSGICARRLMQYLYHQRQRPPDNSIVYWRKFVAEYYSPRAKKRWCLSKYENVGHQALGVFPQATMDSWQCDICRSKSGRGFEATAEVIPRLNEIKFSSGVIDELLFLDYPHECRFPSGIMMLEYGKAVQESVYEQVRVVREGRLRIIFTQELKILSWEFCAHRHEELLPRRLLAPQVNELLQVAQKCQSSIAESGADGISQQELQTNSNRVLTAGRQLAKSMDMQSLNDLGFSKRYVRCLQISEVNNSLVDLMDYCAKQKIGPIEALKSYPRHSSCSKPDTQQNQEIDQLANASNSPANSQTMNKLMATHQGLRNPMVNDQTIMSGVTIGGPAQAVMAMTNYHKLLARQNSTASNPNSMQQEASSSFNNSNVEGQSSLVNGPMPNLPVGGFPNAHLVRSFNNNNGLPQQQRLQASQSNQALQQQLMQQMLQKISHNNGASLGQQQTFSGQNENSINAAGRNKVEFQSNATSAPARTRPSISASARSQSPTSSINNSQKTAPTKSSSNAGGGADSGHKPSDIIPQNTSTMAEEDFPDIASELIGSDFFSHDFDSSMNFCWDS